MRMDQPGENLPYLPYLDDLLAPVRVSNTEVLLKVERVLGYPERISHVGSHHLQALHALLAGVAEN